MLQLSVIGNLGADAEVVANNGKPFVKFNVAHTERWTTEDGQRHEQTLWVSCTINGDGGNLLQYLKKGTIIYAVGHRVNTRVFSSEKQRAMVAGLNLGIDHIELIGSRPDEIPSRLYDSNLQMVVVYKAFYIDKQKHQVATLQDQRGNIYDVNEFGYLAKRKEDAAPVEPQTQENTRDNEQSKQAPY